MELEIIQIHNLVQLLAWRAEVIENVFGMTPDASLMQANEAYYRQHTPSGEHEAYIARCDGVEAGCGAICYTAELPSPDNPSGRCAYLMNIYVRAPFRMNGLGHIIVKHLIVKACGRGCDKIYLETTDAGRPIYSELGFEDMTNMMKLNDTQHQR